MKIKSNAVVCVLMFVSGCIPVTESLYRSRMTAPRMCSTPTIKNGSARIKSRGRMVQYKCNSKYILHGNEYSSCSFVRWDNEIPICIKPGCPPIPNVEHGIVGLMHSEASAILVCKPDYILVGSNVAFCDGIRWDRSIGSCRETGVGSYTWCDFETDSICKWENDPDNNFKWLRRSGYATTARLRTGPKHDNTVKVPLEGHYMVAELVNNDPIRLLSPTYNATLSKDACFRFFYHMFGIAVGTLRVYVKPISLDIDTVLDTPSYMLHQIKGSQGNHWLETVATTEEMKEDFQIIMEATSDRGRPSDIAIDDVALLSGGDCIDETLLASTESNEEDDGIYYIQSCTNRCNETTSTSTTDRSVTLKPNGKRVIIEKCDCHPECEDLKSCCLDYRTTCVFVDDTTNMDSTEHTTIPTQAMTNTTQPNVHERTTTAELATTKRTTMTPSTLRTTVTKVTQTTVSTTKSTPATTQRTTTATTKTQTPSTTTSKPKKATEKSMTRTIRPNNKLIKPTSTTSNPVEKSPIANAN